MSRLKSQKPERLYLLTGAAQGFVFSWGLAAVVWWVVELDLSPLRLVLLGSMLELTILIAEVPTGVIADIWSRKWSVCAAYALMGTAMALGPITAFYPALLAWQFLVAIGWTLQSGAATAWVTDETETSADSLIIAHAKWRTIGLILGLPITAAIGVLSAQLAMLVVGLLCVLFSLYLVLSMSETRQFAVTYAQADTSTTDPASTQLIPSGERRTRLWPEALRTAQTGIRRVRKQRVLLVVLISTAFMGAANQAVDSLDTRRITDLGLPEADGAEAILFLGAVWFLMSVLILPLVALLGRRVDEMGTFQSVRLLIILLGGASLGVMGLAVGPWLVVAIAGWVMRDITTELIIPLAEAVVNRETDSSVRATVVSFLGQAESVGQVSGGTALGVLAQFTTVPWALAGAALALAVAALPYLLSGSAVWGNRRRGG